MKILCVIEDLGSGGAQRQLVELAMSLAEENELFFLIYHKHCFDLYSKKLEEANIKIDCIDEDNYLLRLKKMRFFIRNGNYDVVISFLEASCFICELSSFPFKKWKLIVGERSANPNIFKSLKLMIYRWFHLRADWVVSNSRANLDMLFKICPILPKRKTRVIYNALDLSYWYPDYNLRRFADKLEILVAASHQYLKNLNGLIEAVNLLPIEIRERIHISWYGSYGRDGSYNAGIEKIKKYGLDDIFTFYPPTSEIKIEMLKSDVIGLFSFYEGLPNVLCEAMAVGKPILASNISDIPILVENNKSAYLFDPGDVKSIADSIIKLCGLSNDELINMGMINRCRAEVLFAKDKIINEYKSILK